MNPYAPPASSDPSPCRGRKARINVGIDIGTSKVCVAVGEIKPNGTLTIMGVAMVPSHGLDSGVIVDTAQAGECLHAALNAAEEESDVMIKKVHLAIKSASMTGSNHSAGIDLPVKRNRITDRDRKTVDESARALLIPDQNSFIHHLLQTYRIDGMDYPSDPLGLECRRLDALYHIVHGASEPIRNAIKCTTQLAVEVEDVAFSPLAAAHAALDKDAKKKGALLIDLGAGTTDYVMYRDGVVHQSGLLVAGGHQISNDISMACGISFAEAERLKIDAGSALSGKYQIKNAVDAMTNPLIESGKVEKRKLNNIIHARMRETLERLKQKLDAKPRLTDLRAGIFLTGGGSLLPGIDQLTEEIFGIPAHLARGPAIFGFAEKYQDPRYASALGLLRCSQC